MRQTGHFVIILSLRDHVDDFDDDNDGILDIEDDDDDGDGIKDREVQQYRVSINKIRKIYKFAFHVELDHNFNYLI